MAGVADKPDVAAAGWIDVHAHFTTPRYIAAASAAGHEFPDGMRGYPAWTLEDHLRLLDDNGIERAVLSMSSPGVHFGDNSSARALAREVNEVAAAAVSAHPDRFSFFASLPLPDVEASVAELEFALAELGAHGAVLESNASGVYLGDERMNDVYAALADRNGIAFIHPTSPPCFEATSLGRPRPMIEFLFDTARSVVDLVVAGVVDRYPSMPVIVPHAGGVLPMLADRVAGFLSIFGDPDKPAPDLRAALAELHYDLAGDPFPRLIPSLLTLVPRERILYGTDYCWTPAPGVARRLQIIEADSPDWRASTTSAALALLDTVRRHS